MKVGCLGKKAYSRLEAYYVLVKVEAGILEDYSAVRMYKCSMCQAYHLTSKGPATNLNSEWNKIVSEGLGP